LFVNVNLLTMDEEIIPHDLTVLVKDGNIAAIRKSGTITIQPEYIINELPRRRAAG